ncbi:MAG TPA: 16S rRNA pseudouridine(516) synthase [Sutterella sp.]|nr:16S rRNA pseudouridine(516) synthase [Sutterella sp.]
MRAEQMLFTQGFGTRHECRGLIDQGRVALQDKILRSSQDEVDPLGKWFTVDNNRWPYVQKAVIVLNKPLGYECSMRPTEHPSVLGLLPAPLRYRGVQPVGRLDADTTGLLLLTDDGALNHRLTHPKHHIEKTYRVTLKHAVQGDFAQRLLEGVLLKDEKASIRAEQCTILSDNQIEVTVTSGKYHQVKRMIAAAGNRVIALHRESMGGLALPTGLEPGAWTWWFHFPWN